MKHHEAGFGEEPEAGGWLQLVSGVVDLVPLGSCPSAATVLYFPTGLPPETLNFGGSSPGAVRVCLAGRAASASKFP